MPERLIDLTEHQITILQRLLPGELLLVELAPDDATHLTIFKNRGMVDIYKGDDDRVTVRLTEDGVRLAALANVKQAERMREEGGA